MAIAGLHNVPVIESSILRESQSSSSGRRGNPGRINTRASSILQMWRELEDECAVNRARERGRPRLHREVSDDLSREGEGRGGLEESSESENGSVINSERHMGPANEQDDHQSMTSEQSQDFGEVERERVRKIFREWMSSGGTVETPRVAHISRGSRAPWLGENERERVRVVRDWIQMTSQEREMSPRNREDQVAETGSPIEQVRDGLVLDHNEGQTENSRRQIRKLCGRQALLDLLTKKEQERRQELQSLEGSQPVSNFAHRNRIQSLLRLRSFQNTTSCESRRPSSAAESELGMLRQRQTVSGLREGFLSRLDSSSHVQASDLSDGPSDNNSDIFRDDQTQANSGSEVLDSTPEQNDPANEVVNEDHEQIDPKGDADVGPSKKQMPSMDHENNDLKGDAVAGPSTAQPLSMDHGIGPSTDLDQLTDCSNADANLQQMEARVEARLEDAMNSALENRPDEVNSIHLDDFFNDGSPQMNVREPSRSGSGEFNDLQERHEAFSEDETDGEEFSIHNDSDDQAHASENLNHHESSMPMNDWQEQVSEYEREWGSSAVPNPWRDDQVGAEGRHWPGDGEDLSHGALESEGAEQNDVQEDFWHENGSLETPRDWLGMPSGSGLASDRADTYYFSDDDNVYHIELRELVNRRTVSSLLHSDFRESLDQLVQSYVERQANAPDDWELHEVLPPPFVTRNREQLRTEEEESGPDVIQAEGSERMLPIPPPLPQANWGQGLHRSNWARHEIRHGPGTEWEIINDLRIDMARLQQRMNNMQRMLEACMDMQLELQRSVRQEVSAALNRSVNSSELLENILPKDSFKWDSVRKGVCCICSNTNIDSLLYRCGHMCTCTKCANVLIQNNGKCPMCQAPVIEVIRAYFIQ